jgi:hypothetical protein
MGKSFIRYIKGEDTNLMKKLCHNYGKIENLLIELGGHGGNVIHGDHSGLRWLVK